MLKVKRFSNSLLVFVILSMSFTSCKSQNREQYMAEPNTGESNGITLFLSGDVMTGRGIDQAFPHSVDSILYESYVKNAREYLFLAERESGEIPTPLSYDYLWGDALEVWREVGPKFKIINLETSITTHNVPYPGKGINYRMHPKNVEVFKAAGIDFCSLANNHTLDWKRPGLIETLNTLNDAEIKNAGAGENREAAGEPAILETEKGRVLVFSYGSPTSGIPYEWQAQSTHSGVNLLSVMSDEQVAKIRKHISEFIKPNDVVIFSIHWGGNWGYNIANTQREFAHELIDKAGVDIIHGHSSHHPMGIEVYNEKLIIYGAGDFVNDYEGIGGRERYRGELSLMYFPTVDRRSGKLISVQMVPMIMRKFQLHHTSDSDAQWLQNMLNREGQYLGTSVEKDESNRLWLKWSGR